MKVGEKLETRVLHAVRFWAYVLRDKNDGAAAFAPMARAQTWAPLSNNFGSPEQASNLTL